MEMLEQRVLLSAAPATSNPIVPEPILPTAPTPLQGVVSIPSSMGPTLFDETFGINGLYYQVGSNIYAADGSYQTIAIVDAFGSPTISSDVTEFDSHWGLNNYDANGQFFLTIQPLSPTVNTISEDDSDKAGWATETALDVEWAHAVAPKAHILLVEAPSDSFLDLLDANVYAAERPGVVTVSNSWVYQNSSSFFNGEPFVYDGDFVTPTGHMDSNGMSGGVAFFAASGDPYPDELGINYPAASLNVVAVGGMTVGTTLNGNLEGIKPWSGSQGGTDPNYTDKFNEPLVALDADPNTGVWIYNSALGGGGWSVIGGTSLATPAWAAYTAIIDQGLELQGQPSLNSQYLTVAPGENLQQEILTAAEGSLPASTTGNANQLYDAIIAGETFDTFFPGTPPTVNSYPMWPSSNSGPSLKTIPSDNGNTGWGLPEGGNFANFIFNGLSGPAFISGASSTTDYLSFLTQPQDTPAGSAMAPVEIEAISQTTGDVDPNVTGSVTLSLGSAFDTTLNGTTTVTANFANGIATFSDLTISTEGDYSLFATSPDIVPAESSGFEIGAAASSTVAVVTQPSAAWQFGSIPAMVLETLDQFGNLNTSDNSIMHASIESGPAYAVLSGGTAREVSKGIATFTGLSVNEAGTYTLKFTDGTLTPAITASFTVVPIPVERHSLFNEVGLSEPIILLQQERNSTVYTQAGPPSQLEVQATQDAAAVSAATPMFANGYVAVTPAASTSAASPAAVDSPADGTSVATQLLDSNSDVKNLLN